MLELAVLIVVVPLEVLLIVWLCDEYLYVHYAPWWLRYVDWWHALRGRGRCLWTWRG